MRSTTRCRRLARETVVFARPADGFGQAHPVPAPEGFKVALDRTADGRYLVYVVLPGGLERKRESQHLAVAK